MTATDTTATAYYVTGKGSHRHANWGCANSRRAIRTGDVREATATEAELPLCEHCCTPAARARDAATQAAIEAHSAKLAAAAELCPNRGVADPQRYQSTCRSCGKQGTVNRSTGALRAHKPATR